MCAYRKDDQGGLGRATAPGRKRLHGSALAFGCLFAFAASVSGAQALPPGFNESTTISGLDLPTAVRFAPGGQVFVAEKSGLIKAFDNLSDPSATVVADLRVEVYNTWDRGLLGIALDPAFASNRFLYALYTRNAKIGGEPPFWPTLDGTNDDCLGPVEPPDPAEPGPLSEGCVASARLVRLKLSSGLDSVIASKTLIEDEWCQQFPSHSIGSMAFDSQGYLYVSAGDAALYGDSDWGQWGIPKNPCGDPPGAVGDELTPPSAEGGVLRSQDLRTTADPTGLDGSVIRIDPETGDPAPANPLTGPDLNARRIVAYGFRNPFRIAIRPGTDELWVGDVGWGHWEEINRVPAISPGTARNFGWPCYEAAERLYGMLGICQDLYSDSDLGLNPVVAPIFSYEHLQPAFPGDTCDSGSSATSGLAFESSSSFPDHYRDALFFADYARNCIWVMPDTDGDEIPDASAVESFRPDASGPVDLQFGPEGALYYASIGDGQIRKIAYHGPVAVASASPDEGEAPLEVTLSGDGSSDPDDPPESLDFEWDLDADGAYDDANGITVTQTYAAQGSYVARLRVIDPAGNEALGSASIDVGNGAPSPEISTPAEGTTWRVGDTIEFTGSATDPEDGVVPATELDWEVDLAHCPASCHIHSLLGLLGQAGGSVTAPPHEYPSHLVLTLTATDAFGRSASTSRLLDPLTSQITVDSSPPGLEVTLDDQTEPSPLTRTEIVGSSHGVSTEPAQEHGADEWLWQSWSDNGPLAHSVVATDEDTSVTAKFEFEPELVPVPPVPEPPEPEPEPRTCMGVTATHVGTDFAETIVGGPGNDAIVAAGGSDVIRGRGGEDVICAGRGSDRLRGGGGDDRIAGDAGPDDLRGGAGVDELRGGAGIDTCPDPEADKLSSCG